jgi:hypothetical protein
MIDLDLYLERINHEQFVYVDKNKLMLTLKHEEARRDTNLTLAKRTMAANSSYEYNSLNSESVFPYLVNVEGCPYERFSKKGVERASLDMKKVLGPLYENGYAQEFLGYYMTYSSLKSRCARMEKLPRLFSESDKVSSTGSTLYKLHFIAEQQQNLRFNYHDSDLVSIPREYTSCYAAEDGYVLAWGDFEQSDLRIAYNLLLRDSWNGPIMDKYDDKYEGISAILDEWENVPHNHDKFMAERDLYKVNVLQTLYGQRHGQTPRDQEFIGRFAKYLDTCPRYSEYYRRISDCFDLGLMIPVTGYFGYEQPVTMYTKKDAINKCLNTPVQTGTSQIVILTCNAILDMFYDLGYTKEDVSLYIVRHDEPVFKMKKEVLKDAWVFNQASSIIVDDWTPLALSFEYGTYYKEVDTDLQQLAEASYTANADKISICVPDEAGEEYWPVPETYTLYAGTEVVGEKTVLSIYSDKANEVAYFLADSTIKEDIVNVLKQKVLQVQHQYAEAGYRGVVIYNDMIREEFYDEVMFFKFINTSNKHRSLAKVLASYAAIKYATRENIQMDGFDSLKLDVDSNSVFIRSVGVLDVIQGQDA